MPLEKLIWLIPLLPFAGFLINGFVGRRLPRPLVSLIGCGTMLGSFIVAVLVFMQVKSTGITLESSVLTWIHVPGTDGEYGGFMSFLAEHKLVADRLSCIMILVVTGVGFLIHLYSIGYMSGDKRYSRYFAYLNLFSGFMLILVLASNLLLMFVGWEGVGLCSYLLIGFWFENVDNAKAGRKAFIVNRIGDLFFTIGVLSLFVYIGSSFGVWTVDFQQLAIVMKEHQGELSVGLLTVVGLLLFGGATGKSAQIPLYTWLPDAMAGPTPVSALIHAATMVTAGVYMVARMGFLYELAPAALLVVAVVGGITAIFAGSIAVVQNDIKKVLAYSTVSQLGFMFMGVGSGFFFAGIFHLMTHAFFKACLFLGSGSVIHGMGGEQDIRKMGGLFKRMPITGITFIIASLALAGLPFVTAGFWSKEGLLGALWVSAAEGPLHVLSLAWLAKFIVLIGFLAAGLTAFYMTRLVLKTFFGEEHWREHMPAAPAHGEEKPKAAASDDLPSWMSDSDDEAEAKPPDEHPPDAHDDHGHGEPHESPWVMTLPLVILSVLSVVGGWAFVFNFTHWMQPAEGYHAPHGPGWMVPLSFVMSIGGIALGYFLFAMRKDIPERIARDNKALHELLLNKYYVDEAYDAIVVNPTTEIAVAAGQFDNVIVDGLVNGTASFTATTSQSTGAFDNEIIDGGVNATGTVVMKTGSALRKLQSGNIKQYLTVAVAGTVFVIAVFCVYLYREHIFELLRRWF